MKEFLAVLNGKPAQSSLSRGSPWQMHLSVCEWTLRLVGFGHYDLSVASEEILELAAEFRFKKEYESLRCVARGEATLMEIARSSRTPTEEEQILRTQLKTLMQRVVAGANTVCTTPYASDEGYYKHYRKNIANAVVLDEAGSMTKTDALLVWRDGMPCIMAGDPRPLPPTV